MQRQEIGTGALDAALASGEPERIGSSVYFAGAAVDDHRGAAVVAFPSRADRQVHLGHLVLRRGEPEALAQVVRQQRVVPQHQLDAVVDAIVTGGGADEEVPAHLVAEIGGVRLRELELWVLGEFGIAARGVLAQQDRHRICLVG